MGMPLARYAPGARLVQGSRRTMQRCRVVPTAATISVLAAISSDRVVRVFSSLVPLPNTLCSMPSKNALVFAVAFGAFHRAL